jgi:energy-coupling factor transporter ATP-binding protein EcfA2
MDEQRRRQRLDKQRRKRRGKHSTHRRAALPYVLPGERKRDTTPEGYVRSDSESSEDLCRPDELYPGANSASDSGGSDHDSNCEDFIDDHSDSEPDRSIYFDAMDIHGGGECSDDTLHDKPDEHSGSDSSSAVRDAAASALESISIRADTSRDDTPCSREPPRPANGYRRSSFMGVPDICVYDTRNNNYLTQCGRYINASSHEEIVKKGYLNVLTGPMGCGKTNLLKTLVAHVKAHEPERKILYITNSRGLCAKSSEALGLASYLQLNLKEEISCNSLGHLVICINSLAKLDYKKTFMDYGLVIIDEIVGCLDSIFSGELIKPELRSKLVQILSMLCNPWRQSGNRATILLIDALMGEREMHFVKEIVKPDSRLKRGESSILNVFRFFPTAIQGDLPEIRYVQHKNRWIRLLVDSMIDKGNDYRICLMTCLREHVFDLLSLVKMVDPDLMDDIRVPLEKAEQTYGKDWLWVDSHTDKPLVENIVNNSSVVLAQYPRFAFTPVFVSGVSFEVPYDIVFCIAATFMSASNLTQMFRRIRTVSERKLILHIIDNPVAVPFNLDFETVKKLVTDYDKIDEKHRLVLASCLSQKNRMNRQHITEYFKTRRDDNVVDLLAYTVLDSLRFKADPKGHIRTLLAQNDPTWSMTVDEVEPGGTPVSGKRVRELMKASFEQYATDTIVTKHDTLLCRDSEEVRRSLALYGACGTQTMESLKLVKGQIYDAHREANKLFVSRCRMALTPFALFTQLLFLGCPKESTAYYCLKDSYNLGRLVTHMFVAMDGPWVHHIGGVSTPNKSSTTHYVALNPDYISDLYVDTYMVVGRWKPLAEWARQYSGILAVNSISLSGEIQPNACPSAAQVTNMKDVICAVFGLLGLPLKLTDDHVLSTGRSNGKRKRQSIKVVIAEAARLGFTEPCPPPTGTTIAVTLSRAVPKLDSLLEYYDRSLRQDCLDYLSNLTGPVSYLSYRLPEGDNGLSGLDAQLIKKFYSHLKKIKMEDFVRPYLDSPSFWLVEDPETYHSKELLFEASEYLRVFMDRVFSGVASAIPSDSLSVV